jgi:tRNA(Ile)-lysidine synthase TilS/MesJ
MMNWKEYGRKRLRPNLRCYPEICLEGLMENRERSVIPSDTKVSKESRRRNFIQALPYVI